MTTDVLDGKAALVTGGGRGLGRTFATALASAGASVAVTARTKDQLDETASAIIEAGGHARGWRADVTEAAAMAAVISEVVATLGPIDILVNNAGVGATFGPVWHLEPSEWWRNMEVNVLGPLLCARLVGPGMIERHAGVVINVASGAGLGPIPNYSAYAVSKAALIRLSENLAAETREHGVQVFAINPGTVRTAMTEAALSQEGQRWLPWTKAYFDEDRFDPPEPAAELVVRLGSGRYGQLSGLFLGTS